MLSEKYKEIKRLEDEAEDEYFALLNKYDSDNEKYGAEMLKVDNERNKLLEKTEDTPELRVHCSLVLREIDKIVGAELEGFVVDYDIFRRPNKTVGNWCVARGKNINIFCDFECEFLTLADAVLLAHELGHAVAHANGLNDELTADEIEMPAVAMEHIFLRDTTLFSYSQKMKFEIERWKKYKHRSCDDAYTFAYEFIYLVK